MYIFVQGAVPKSNSAHCLLLLHISCLIPQINYSANLTKIFYFYKIFLLLMSMFYDFHQNVSPFAFKQLS